LRAPLEDAQRPKRIPAAGSAGRFVEGKGEALAVGTIKKPAAVGLALGLDHLNSLPHARAGARVGAPEIIERAEDVVVVARGESEFEELGVYDLAS